MAASGFRAVFDEEVDEEYRVREVWLNPGNEENILVFLLQTEKTIDQNLLQDWVRAARMDAIDWIIKTRAQFKIKFQTAYITVTYIDQFLSKRLLVEDYYSMNWMVPLLSLACLSLADELDHYSNWKGDVSDISFGDYQFQSSYINRMEQHVVSTLEWKMNPATAFCFIRIFVPKCCKERPNKDVVVATVETIFSTIKDRDFMRYRPSVIAIAATLFAVDPKLTRQSLEISLNEIALVQFFVIDDVYACYERIRQLSPTRLATARGNLLPFPRMILVMKEFCRFNPQLLME